MDEKLLNRIISAAYGDSGMAERMKIRRIVLNQILKQKGFTTVTGMLQRSSCNSW
jgi:hypothetical protein